MHRIRPARRIVHRSTYNARPRMLRGRVCNEPPSKVLACDQLVPSWWARLFCRSPAVDVEIQALVNVGVGHSSSPGLKRGGRAERMAWRLLTDFTPKVEMKYGLAVSATFMGLNTGVRLDTVCGIPEQVTINPSPRNSGYLTTKPSGWLMYLTNDGNLVGAVRLAGGIVRNLDMEALVPDTTFPLCCAVGSARLKEFLVGAIS